MASSFAISPLADLVGCYSGFPSTTQHVTRNALGTFYAIETAIGNISVGAPNNFAVLWDNGSGSITTLWAPSPLPTNMVCIESFSTGELYAVWCDYVNGVFYIAYWANLAWSLTPTVTTFSGAGCINNGKIGTVIDEARRCLFIVGDMGWIFCVSDTGALLGRQQIWQALTDAPNYVSVLLDVTGWLYILICSATNASPSTYDFVGAIMSPNPGDVGRTPNAAWTAHAPYPVSSWLTLPIDPGQDGLSQSLFLWEQARDNNNLLLGGAVRQGNLLACIAEAPSIAERFFDRDDLGHCTTQLVAWPWGVDPWMGGYTHRPLRVGDVIPRAGSGSPTFRSSGAFVVLHDRSNLLALKSTNHGKTWTVFSVTPVPGLGADMIHYVSLYRGAYDDTDIVGMFVVEHCTPSQWANSTCPVPPAYAPNNPAATAYRFELAI